MCAAKVHAAKANATLANNVSDPNAKAKPAPDSASTPQPNGTNPSKPMSASSKHRPSLRKKWTMQLVRKPYQATIIANYNRQL
jgi:hypothetical protein